MSLLPVELLKKLGSGVRPGEGGRSKAARSPGDIDFRSLIESARAGRIRSDRPTEWERGSDLDLEEQTRTLIDEALDRAEAAGAHRLIVAHPGGLWTADVAQRRIRPLDPTAPGVFGIGVEAVLVLTGDPDAFGTLEDLDELESGTGSAKRGGAIGLGWISNRSLNAVIAAAEQHDPHSKS